MKLNLKAWLGAFCMLFATANASAAPEQPTFSTTEDPVWYNVTFTSGGNVFKSAGNTVALSTAEASDADACLWQLIGSPESFKMVSKAGRYAYVKSDGTYAGGTAAKAGNLSLRQTGDNWEIGVVGETNVATQTANTVSAKIKAAAPGSANSSISFALYEVPVLVGQPVFSAEGEEPTWFYLRFNQNEHVIQDMGLGNNVKHVSIQPNSEGTSQWKLVGNSANFQVVNKDGHYLNGAGDRLTTSDAPYAQGFSLVTLAADGTTWEIKNNRITGNNSNFNMFGGANDANAQVGFWQKGDAGNSISFININDYEYPEVLSLTGSSTFKPEEPLTLWYTRSSASSDNAHKWMDLGLPIGNGQLGAMILGNVLKEDISVNEKTLWTGDTQLRGSYAYGCYQNFGSLYVRTREEGISTNEPVSDYWRDLNLATGLARVHYKNAAGTSFDRKYIASNPDNVVAALFSSDKPGAVSLNFEEVPGMSVNHAVTYSVADGVATIEYHGKFEIISYCSVIKIMPKGENATIALAEGGKSIDVSNADEVYVVIAAGTDYDAVAPSYTSETAALQGNMETLAANALAKGWDSVLADQKADHEALFNRVSFNLDGAKNEMPTDQMRAYYNTTTAANLDSDDPAVKMLEMLYFHYGRYLEIGSSRGVDLPGNLQGIWSGYNVFKPHSGGQVVPWNGDIHTNINVQMCYWPCEPTNLSELHLPLLNYIINQATVQPQWRNFAHEVTTPAAPDPDAWTCAVENNIFGGMGSYDTKYSVANAWYCTHLWQHYAYTLDKEFLARALPTMWGATKFWLDRMIKASDGTYECPSESSPEHGPNQNGVAHAQQIVAELFSNVLEAIEALPDQTVINEAGIARLRDRYAKMDKGLAIETYTGAWGENSNGIVTGDDLLREWKYADYTAGQNGHRHISHLMCLYPFSQVEPGTREFQAAVNSLRQRGDAATGWSIGWKINLWARAFDGDHARKILRNGLCNNAYNNLFDSHAPFQIDGNFGACTGITEMLLQSRKGIIWVLPALPALWADGEVNGLKAERDFTIDIKWKNSKIELATLTANQGGQLNLGNADLVNTRIELNGQPVEPTIYHNPKTKQITTMIKDLKPGDKVTLVYDAAYTQPDVKEEEMVKIDEVESPASAPSVSVSNGIVSVNAPVASIQAFDLAGRQIAATAASTLKINAKGVVLVKVTDLAGNVQTVKATI